jgi:hypothetical protein
MLVKGGEGTMWGFLKEVPHAPKNFTKKESNVLQRAV